MAVEERAQEVGAASMRGDGLVRSHITYHSSNGAALGVLLDMRRAASVLMEGSLRADGRMILH